MFRGKTMLYWYKGNRRPWKDSLSANRSQGRNWWKRTTKITGQWQESDVAANKTTGSLGSCTSAEHKGCVPGFIFIFIFIFIIQSNKGCVQSSALTLLFSFSSLKWGCLHFAWLSSLYASVLVDVKRTFNRSTSGRLMWLHQGLSYCPKTPLFPALFLLQPWIHSIGMFHCITFNVENIGTKWIPMKWCKRSMSVQKYSRLWSNDVWLMDWQSASCRNSIFSRHQ